MALTTSLNLSLSSRRTQTVGLLAENAFTVSRNETQSLADGSGAGQADLVYHATRTLSAEGTHDLDLAGSLTDTFGAVIDFASIKMLYIKAASSNGEALIFGGAVSNAWVGPFDADDNTIAVPPGGMLVLTAPGDGWPVTAGTGDLLKVENPDTEGSASYDVILIGASE